MNYILAAVTALPLLAGPRQVDWKYFGATAGNTSSQTLRYFYDGASVKRSADGHLQVWVKALDDQLMVHTVLTRAEIDLSNSRVKHRYLPPYSKLYRISRGEFINVLGFEAQADGGEVPSSNQSLWEIDCKAQAMRKLDSVVGSDNTIGTESRPVEWMQPAPESMGSHVIQSVCT